MWMIKINCDVYCTEPVLQWSLGTRVSTPPDIATPVKVDVSSSPCSRDVKVLAAQFTKGQLSDSCHIVKQMLYLF